MIEVVAWREAGPVLGNALLNIDGVLEEDVPGRRDLKGRDLVFDLLLLNLLFLDLLFLNLDRLRGALAAPADKSTEKILNATELLDLALKVGSKASN